MTDNFSVEPFPGLRLERRRMNGAGAGGEAGALLANGAEPLLVAAEPFHPAHHAVVLAVPAAACGKIRLGIGSKEWRDQQPTEHHQQRKCDRAPHSHANSIRRSATAPW